MIPITKRTKGRKTKSSAVAAPDHLALAICAADHAERALPYFETHRPTDTRPREAIDAARAWAKGEISVATAREAAFAAHAAARETDDPAATGAARSAGHAAATAHVAGHARHAAAYAEKAEAFAGDASVAIKER